MNKNITNYITDLEEYSDFSSSQVSVEHRSNNPRRDYLFVNHVQAKHIPCNPLNTIQMVGYLSAKLLGVLKEDDSVLVVAFAETATALGNLLADTLPMCTMVVQTTREAIKSTDDFLTFEEEHSHATQHRIIMPDIQQFSYILFVDDEITTGKTILNFINAMQLEESNVHMRFGVASICNWQNEYYAHIFKSLNIDTFCLLRGGISDINQKVQDYIPSMKPSAIQQAIPVLLPDVTIALDLVDERFPHKSRREIERLLVEIRSGCPGDALSFRVIGTEEFMYLPIKFAEYLACCGGDLYCHSTTRSKIDIAEPYEKGLCSRHEFSSVYEADRRVYLYNLEKYTDMILVLTDGSNTTAFKKELAAVCNCKYLKFVQLKWKDSL